MTHDAFRHLARRIAEQCFGDRTSETDIEDVMNWLSYDYTPAPISAPDGAISQAIIRRLAAQFEIDVYPHGHS